MDMEIGLGGGRGRSSFVAEYTVECPTNKFNPFWEKGKADKDERDPDPNRLD